MRSGRPSAPDHDKQWQIAFLLLAHCRRRSASGSSRCSGSPTEGLGTTVELDASAPAALVIPVGVAHGFYFHEPSIHVYAVSHEFDPADELGCRWDDSELDIAWPCADPLLSQRDQGLGPLTELRAVWHGEPAPV
mgnify:CR=1 FL=1